MGFSATHTHTHKEMWSCECSRYDFTVKTVHAVSCFLNCSWYTSTPSAFYWYILMYLLGTTSRDQFLPLPVCQNGQKVHWESSPTPAPCTVKPNWWNPRCLQKGCCRDREKGTKVIVLSVLPFNPFHIINSTSYLQLILFISSLSVEINAH